MPRNSHLSWTLKGLRSKFFLALFLFSGKCTYTLKAQSDTLPYSLFNDQLVIYSDLGYSTAPFTILYPFSNSTDRLKFKNNYRNILGFGLCYKWFSLRLSFPLPGYARQVERYGKTAPFNVGFDFSLKKFFFDTDLRFFKGYAIKDAYTWNDTLTSASPNLLRPDAQSLSFSMNTWYFNNKNFKMSALRGKTGHYNSAVQTWYIKGTFNVFGSSNGSSELIPGGLQSNKPQTSSISYSATDVGIVPGYAYVNRINNWQFSVIGGIGGVFQAKFYENNGLPRGFLGLAPRYDFRMMGGYSVPSWFIFLITDFDNKSIRFGELIYRQNYYSIKVVAGKRFPEKSRKK